MKKRLTMILASLLFVVTGAFAQMQVSGTVISQDDNQPVAGATVQVVGAPNVGTRWTEELANQLRGYGTHRGKCPFQHAYPAHQRSAGPG